MKETLPTPTIEKPVDAETIQEIDDIETTMELPPSEQRLLEAKEQLAQLLDERDKRKAQEAALATYETPFVPDEPAPTLEMPAVQPEQASSEEREHQTTSTLRSIGDKALKFMEKRGQGKTAKILESWGIIPVINTRHKQHGFSAWIARKYVNAQEARKRRERRIGAGFLSPEAQAQLNNQQPEEKETDAVETPDTPSEKNDTPSPEKAAQPDGAAAHEREEAHEEAEEAEERRAERHEKQPFRERSAEARQRLSALKGRIGESAMKFLKKTGALASKLKRRSAK